MLRKILALLLLGVAPLAIAQAVPGTATVGWTLPTVGCTVGASPCDNAPLTGTNALTAVEVYISTSPITDSSTMAPTLTLAAGTTTSTHTLQVTNGATLYARVKAVSGGNKSPFSVQVTKVVSVPVIPGVPTNVTITIQIG